MCIRDRAWVNHHSACWPSSIRQDLPRETLPERRTWSSIDPDAAGYSAMSYWMPECVEEDSNGIGVVVRLREVTQRPVSNVLGSDSSEISAIQAGQVLQGAEARGKGGKIGVCDTTITSVSRWREADTDILFEALKPAPNEALREPAGCVNACASMRGQRLHIVRPSCVKE